MKKMRMGLMILISGTVSLLGGCAKFDAASYTKAVLDVSYKNEAENYIELTGAAEEDAEAVFQKNLDVTMEAFKETELSEELEDNYRSLFEDIMKQVKYSVGEGEKSEDGSYTVDVSVEPITLFDDTYEEFQTKAQEYAVSITNSVMNGEEMPSDEEMQANVYQIYYDILKENVDSGVNYGEPEQITMHIYKAEDGAYEIAKEDIMILDESLISRKLLMQ